MYRVIRSEVREPVGSEVATMANPPRLSVWSCDMVGLFPSNNESK